MAKYKIYSNKIILDGGEINPALFNAQDEEPYGIADFESDLPIIFELSDGTDITEEVFDKNIRNFRTIGEKLFADVYDEDGNLETEQTRIFVKTDDGELLIGGEFDVKLGNIEMTKTESVEADVDVNVSIRVPNDDGEYVSVDKVVNGTDNVRIYFEIVGGTTDYEIINVVINGEEIDKPRSQEYCEIEDTISDDTIFDISFEVDQEK